MAEAEMTKRSGERRRRRTSIAGSILNVNFNGGGGALLLGAAAGAFLAAAFAAYRVRAHKRKRGSRTEGNQENSGEHIASHEAKDFVGIEAEVGNGANTGNGGIQVNSPENLDASFQISEVIHRESDFYVLEGKVGPERSPTRDIEQHDRARGELPGFRDLSADISSSPASTWRNLEIGCSLGECQLGYDDEELVTTGVTKEGETPCINSKEDDEEDNKKAYIEEWSEKEKIKEKITPPNLYSEQLGLLENNNFKISEKSLEIEEFHLEAGTQELETSPSKVEESKDETISVLSYELQTRQDLEADKDKRTDRLEMKTEYSKIVGVDEIHNESQDQIKEQDEQIAKLSFDVVEEGVKTADKAMKQDTTIQLIDVEKKHQRLVEANEKNVSSKGKQQRTAAKKEKGTEHMFIGYPKCHCFLVTLLATVFAVLASLYHAGFFHQNHHLRTAHFEKYDEHF